MNIYIINQDSYIEQHHSVHRYIEQIALYHAWKVHVINFNSGTLLQNLQHDSPVFSSFDTFATFIDSCERTDPPFYTSQDISHTSVGRYDMPLNASQLYDSAADGLRQYSPPLFDLLSIDLSICRKKLLSEAFNQQAAKRFASTTFILAYSLACHIEKLITKQSNEEALCLLFNVYTCSSYVQYLSGKGRFKSLTTRTVTQNPATGRIVLADCVHLEYYRRRLMQSSTFEYAESLEYFSYAESYVANKILNSNCPWTYSPPIDSSPINMLNDDSHCKKIAFFSSSPDELQSIETRSRYFSPYQNSMAPLFASEYEFLRFVLDQTILDPELHIYVRLHPRLGIEKRSDCHSSARELYIDLLSEYRVLLGGRLTVYEPESLVNSFQLGLSCHLSLYWWSSMGFELSLLGARTLTGVANYLNLNVNLSFVSDNFPETRLDWLDLFRRHLSEECITDAAYEAARAFFICNIAGTFDLSEPITTDIRLQFREALEKGTSSCVAKPFYSSKYHSNHRDSYRVYLKKLFLEYPGLYCQKAKLRIGVNTLI